MIDKIYFWATGEKGIVVLRDDGKYLFKCHISLFNLIQLCLYKRIMPENNFKYHLSIWLFLITFSMNMQRWVKRHFYNFVQSMKSKSFFLCIYSHDMFCIDTGRSVAIDEIENYNLSQKRLSCMNKTFLINGGFTWAKKEDQSLCKLLNMTWKVEAVSFDPLICSRFLQWLWNNKF